MCRALTPAVEPLQQDVAGFVLAGGRSSRMGRDKALVPLGGLPLVAHGLAIFRQAGLTPVIAGGVEDLAAFAPLVEDQTPGKGPLSGICAALASTSARWAVVLPVDLPLIPASLLIALLRNAQVTERPVTVSTINGFTQTFPAVLDRVTLPALQSELDAGRGGCFSAFRVAATGQRNRVAVIPVEMLAQTGQVDHPAGLPPPCWFLNLNTEADLGRAEARLNSRASATENHASIA